MLKDFEGLGCEAVVLSGKLCRGTIWLPNDEEFSRSNAKRRG